MTLNLLRNQGTILARMKECIFLIRKKVFFRLNMMKVLFSVNCKLPFFDRKLIMLIIGKILTMIWPHYLYYHYYLLLFLILMMMLYPFLFPILFTLFIFSSPSIFQQFILLVSMEDV